MEYPVFTPETLVGNVLGGTWANSMLFGAEIIFLAAYFSRPRVHPKAIDAAVITLFMSDIACTVCEWLLTYRLLITHYGDFPYVIQDSAQLYFYPITTGISGLFVQSYLTHRIFILSRSVLATIFLGCCILLSFGSMIWFTTIISLDQSLRSRGAYHIPGTVWAASAVGVNCLIALALVYLLARMKGRTTVDRTRSILQRAIWIAFESGAAPSAVAIAAMIGSSVSPFSNWCPTFTFSLGRVYMLTLLFNLSQKQNHAVESSVSGSTHPNASFPASVTHGKASGLLSPKAQILSVDGSRSSEVSKTSSLPTYEVPIRYSPPRPAPPTFSIPLTEVKVSQEVYETEEKDDSAYSHENKNPTTQTIHTLPSSKAVPWV